MSSTLENNYYPIVEVLFRGDKEWTVIEDPGEYSLRRALEKCQIDGYRVIAARC